MQLRGCGCTLVGRGCSVKRAFYFIVFLVLLAASGAEAVTNPPYSTLFAYSAAAPSASPGNPKINSGTLYHQLVWTTSGTVATCAVQVDSSADNVNWSSAAVITSQTCTSNGSAAITSGTYNYVRIKVTAITGGGSINAVYTGYLTNPAGGGNPAGSTGDLQTNNGSGGFGSVPQSSFLPVNNPTATGTLSAPTVLIGNGTVSAPALAFTGTPTMGFFNSGGVLGYATGGVQSIDFSTGITLLGNGAFSVIGTGSFLLSNDTNFSRDSAGVMDLGNGTVGNSSGTLKAAIVNLGTGVQIGGTATAGNVLRGNGTNFVSAQLAATDISGIYNPISFTATLTPGTNITSTTCATATCTNLRGTITIVAGALATTGTVASLS